jgi:uncharacterized protein (DUF1330 family)
MTRSRFLPLLALSLSVLTAVIWWWQNPGGPITAAETERYLAAVERLPLPAEHRDATLASVRRFIAEDDGRPIQMLNLMRFFPKLRPIAGSDVGFTGTPVESNQRYEDAAIPMLFRGGGYPAYAGTVRGGNVIATDAALDGWNRVLLVRYPNRRAFMNLLANPAYAPIAPYKLQALELVLTPTEAEIIMPPLPLLVGIFSLLLFLATGWWHAARRSPR